MAEDLTDFQLLKAPDQVRAFSIIRNRLKEGQSLPSAFDSWAQEFPSEIEHAERAKRSIELMLSPYGSDVEWCEAQGFAGDSYDIYQWRIDWIDAFISDLNADILKAMNKRGIR